MKTLEIVTLGLYFVNVIKTMTSCLNIFNFCFTETYDIP